MQRIGPVLSDFAAGRLAPVRGGNRVPCPPGYPADSLIQGFRVPRIRALRTRPRSRRSGCLLDLRTRQNPLPVDPFRVSLDPILGRATLLAYSFSSGSLWNPR